MVLSRRPPNVADKALGRHRSGVGFLSHLRSLGATMGQKSSVPQAASFVSQALKRDTVGCSPNKSSLVGKTAKRLVAGRPARFRTRCPLWAPLKSRSAESPGQPMSKRLVAEPN